MVLFSISVNNRFLPKRDTVCILVPWLGFSFMYLLSLFLKLLTNCLCKHSTHPIRSMSPVNKLRTNLPKAFTWIHNKLKNHSHNIVLERQYVSLH